MFKCNKYDDRLEKKGIRKESPIILNQTMDEIIRTSEKMFADISMIETEVV